MTEKLKIWLGLVILMSMVVGGTYALYKLIDYFSTVDKTVLMAVMTAATTVMAATVAVVLAKYYERKMDIEAQHRLKNIEIYDQFLKTIFNMFSNEERNDGKNKEQGNQNGEQAMVAFLREWQRELVLWGGQNVLNAYSSWISDLKNQSATGNAISARSVLLMEELFFEIRKDIGHKNNKLKKGIFIALIVKEGNVLVQKIEENPEITLEEVANLDK